MSEAPSKSELRKILRALERRLNEHPMDFDARMRLARTCRLLGLRDDAVTQYATVARALALAGHALQASAVLRELLQVAPDHEETLKYLAALSSRAAGSHAPPPPGPMVYAPEEVGARLEDDAQEVPSDPATLEDVDFGSGYEVLGLMTTGDLVLPTPTPTGALPLGAEDTGEPGGGCRHSGMDRAPD